MFNRLLMIDLEFTDLDRSNAFVWEWGFEVVGFPQTRNVYQSDRRSIGIAPVSWGPNTWHWAQEQYPSSVLNQHYNARPDAVYAEEGELLQYLHAKLSNMDLSNTIVMSNHTEVDIALLVDKWTAMGLAAPWPYRNVQDLQSVIWGCVGYRPEDFDKVKGSEKVAHTALADCRSQIAWLGRALVYRGVI